MLHYTAVTYTYPATIKQNTTKNPFITHCQSNALTLITIHYSFTVFAPAPCTTSSADINDVRRFDENVYSAQ